MLEFVCPRLPLHGSFYLAVALLLPLIIIWLFRKVLALTRGLPATQQQIGAIPPRTIPSLLNSNEVAAAAAAAAATPSVSCAFIRPILFPDPRQADSSESDCSDDERRPVNRHFSYPRIQFLDIGGARLFDPASLERFRELVRGLPDAKMRSKAFQDAREDGGVYRLSDVPQHPWILRGGTETIPGPCVLTNGSTKTWVKKLKTTTKIICSIRRELNEQGWQLCKEIKEELFTEVAGESLDRVLEETRSFINKRCHHGNISQQLAIFDALVDVLFNIWGLGLNRSIEAADILNKMVNVLEGVIDKATYDIHSSEECTIHPATIGLMQAMGFFYRNKDMMKSTFDNGNDGTDSLSVMYCCWLSKLTADAEGTFKEKGRQYVFILDNIYYFQQKKCHPELLPSVLLSGLNSEIEQYIRMYLDECWLPPVVSYQGGGSRNRSRRISLKKFTGEIYNICDKQMTWKVQPALKTVLREEIVKFVVPEYQKIFKQVQANPSRARSKHFWRTKTETQQEDISAKLEEAIRAVFES